MRQLLRWLPAVLLCLQAVSCRNVGPAVRKETERRGPKQAAERMIRAAEGNLAPVYAPLARQIAKDFNLAGKKGVGIDLGSGPGTLIVELCKHTDLHWINADINPHCFPYFIKKAEEGGFSGRVSAIRADACSLPFPDNYADVIVSRGSFHFWPDLEKSLREVYRVLKPGGTAYIGRGLSRDLPLKTARSVREKQGGSLNYDPDKQAKKLRKLLKKIGVKDHEVTRPKAPGGADVNYGVWAEFHKPDAVEKTPVAK